MNLLFALVRFFYNLLILNNNDDLNHELMPKIDKYRDVPRTLPNIYFEKKTIFAKDSIIDVWQGPKHVLNPLSTSPAKWLNTLKQFVG